MTLSLPKCGCSEKSVEGRVFTCPVCCRAALRYWDGERVDQLEVFDEVDNQGSVSVLSRRGGELTHISKIVPIVLLDDGLPF